jgi:hypothetical protein
MVARQTSTISYAQVGMENIEYVDAAKATAENKRYQQETMALQFRVVLVANAEVDGYHDLCGVYL